MTRKRFPDPVRTPWHRNESGCWSLSLGWRGCRVRVAQRQPGGIFHRVVWIPGRGRDYTSLETPDRTEAQGRAETFLKALIANDGTIPPAPLTLGELVTKYQQEAPAYQENTKTTRDQKRASAGRLIAFFGAEQRVTHLTPNDIARFVVARRAGLRVNGRVYEPVGTTPFVTTWRCSERWSFGPLGSAGPMERSCWLRTRCEASSSLGSKIPGVPWRRLIASRR